MKKWILILPMLLLFAACTSTENTDSSKNAQVEDQQTTKLAINRLNDVWALVAANGKDLDFSDTTIYQPSLELHLKDSMAIGNTNCNNFQAKFILDGDKISFPPFVMTQMFCPGYENVFVKGIMATATYKLDDLKLFFYDKDGNEVLGFKKVD